MSRNPLAVSQCPHHVFVGVEGCQHDHLGSSGCPMVVPGFRIVDGRSVRSRRW